LHPRARSSAITHFRRSQFHLSNAGGVADLRVDGAIPSVQAGAPELPWIGETIDLPDGFRATKNRDRFARSPVMDERLSVCQSAWIKGADGQSVRSAPDARSFTRGGFQPDAQAVLGPQGYMRGQGIASFRICPVRWDAATGQLQRVAHVTVRITLEPTLDRPTPRLRVVPEWEDGPVSGPLRPRAEQAMASYGGTRTAGSFAADADSVDARQPGPVRDHHRRHAGGRIPAAGGLEDAERRAGGPCARCRSFAASIRGAPTTPSAYATSSAIAYSRWGTKWVLIGGDTDVIPCATRATSTTSRPAKTSRATSTTRASTVTGTAMVTICTARATRRACPATTPTCIPTCTSAARRRAP
jgi:hypothetical protein